MSHNFSLSRYINLLVFANALPIFIYILFPGTVGIGVGINSIITIYAFTMLWRNGYLLKLKNTIGLKLWLFALSVGFLQSLVTGMKGGSFVAFAIAFLEQLNLLFVFAVLNLRSIAYFLKAFIYIFIPLGVFSAIFWDGYLLMDTPHIMNSLTIFAVTLFFFPPKYRIMIIGALVFAALVDSSVRSCLLSSIVVILLAVIFYFCRKSLYLFKLIHAGFFFFPFVFSVMGFLGLYNVFEAMENSNIRVESVGKKGTAGRSFIVDSRTLVYKDAIMNIQSVESLLFGQGPAYTIKSFVAFKGRSSETLYGRGHMEAGILNILLFYGLFGCFCFCFFCFSASSLALKSNNSFTKLIALFVAYKFLYIFIEDASINFTTYLAIGICLNNNLRQFTDQQIKKRLSIIL